MPQRPPNIRIPGLRSKTGVPGGSRGVLIGRKSGFGALQVLTQGDLIQMGVKAPSQGSIVNQAGFTFSVSGVPANNEFIGRGVWSKDLHFHNLDPNNTVTSLSGANGTPSFRMLSDALVLLGTIQFTTPTVGVVTWLSDPYVHPAGAGMLLYAPTPMDSTLATISGRVVGYV